MSADEWPECFGSPSTILSENQITSNTCQTLPEEEKFIDVSFENSLKVFHSARYSVLEKTIKYYYPSI